MSDMRLLDHLCQAAGFVPGSDLRWLVECLRELADDALEPGGEPGLAALDRAPLTSRQIAQHLLHLMGSQHLVCGRYHPPSLSSGEIGELPQLRRVRGKAVEMLAALAEDARRDSGRWSGFTEALRDLGAPRVRAERMARLFGPITGEAARLLTVLPPVITQSVLPSVGDRAGATLALSDLVAISTLLQDHASK
jgi:hypothetical protein